MMTRSVLRNQKNNILKDSAILSLRDFERIKQNSQTSPNEILSGHGPSELALRHKQKLIEFDKKNKQNFLIDFDKNLVNDGGKEQLLKEEPDDVKNMNLLMRYAKMATIRDRQLAERKVMEDMYINKEKKLDVMMELERLKELQFQEAKEKEIKRQQKEGSLIIIEQIKENEFERLRKKEQLEREKVQMLRQIQALAEEEKRNLIAKKQRHELLNREAAAANAHARFAKEMKKIQEREVDLAVMKFNRDKARQEEEFLREKKRIQDEKEREVQRLREKQEKAQDKQAELDAIRSKRAYEESEKQAREKEARELAEQQRKLMEMIRDNEMAIRAKKKVEEELAKKEKDEFNKVLERHKIEIEREKDQERARKQMFHDNQEAVLKQIDEKADKDIIKKREIREEGRKIKAEIDNYMKNMELIKQDKVKELQNLNIDPKYILDLKKYKIMGH